MMTTTTPKTTRLFNTVRRAIGDQQMQAELGLEHDPITYQQLINAANDGKELPRDVTESVLDVAAAYMVES